MITPKTTLADPTSGGEIFVCDPSQGVIIIPKVHTNTGNGAAPEQLSLSEEEPT